VRGKRGGGNHQGEIIGILVRGGEWSQHRCAPPPPPGGGGVR